MTNGSYMWRMYCGEHAFYQVKLQASAHTYCFSIDPRKYPYPGHCEAICRKNWWVKRAKKCWQNRWRIGTGCTRKSLRDCTTMMCTWSNAICQMYAPTSMFVTSLPQGIMCYCDAGGGTNCQSKQIDPTDLSDTIVSHPDTSPR